MRESGAGPGGRGGAAAARLPRPERPRLIEPRLLFLHHHIHRGERASELEALMLYFYYSLVLRRRS